MLLLLQWALCGLCLSVSNVLSNRIACITNTQILFQERQADMFCHCSGVPAMHHSFAFSSSSTTSSSTESYSRTATVNLADLIPKQNKQIISSLVVYLENCPQLSYFVTNDTLAQWPLINNFIIQCSATRELSTQTDIRLNALFDANPHIRTVTLCARRLLDTYSPANNLSSKAWPIEKFRYNGPCNAHFMRAITLMKTTLKQLDVLCSELAVNIILTDFTQLVDVSLRLERFSLTPNSYTVSLTRLPRLRSLVLVVSRDPPELILYDLPKLARVDMRSYEVGKSSVVSKVHCGKISNEIEELYFDNWSLQWLRQCNLLWSCCACNACKSIQAVSFLHEDSAFPANSMKGVLPSKKQCPCFNIRQLHTDVSTFSTVMDELHRFPWLQEYLQFTTSTRQPIQRLVKNEFANLPHPERLTLVQLSIAECDKITLEMIHWLQTHTAGNATKVKIVCWNFLPAIGWNYSDHFEWPSLSNLTQMLQQQSTGKGGRSVPGWGIFLLLMVQLLMLV